jgi:hypothetical protein
VLLADRIVGNGGSPAKYRERQTTLAWRDPMRLLLDKDLAVDQHGNTVPPAERVEKARKAITWCQDDDFWRGNILSPGKLREQYDALRLAAQRDQNGHGHGNGHRRPEPERRTIPITDLSTRPPLGDAAALDRWAQQQVEEAARNGTTNPDHQQRQPADPGAAARDHPGP